MKEYKFDLQFRSRSLDNLEDASFEEPPPCDATRRKSICVSRLPDPMRRGSRSDTIHSTRAGSLCYYRHKKRTCFIEHGFVKHALERMIVRKYGEETWEEIKNISNARFESDFLLGLFNDEQLTYDVVEAAAQVVGTQKAKIWELFGEMFFEFCEDSGYDKILQVLGGTLMEFLENLDALHDHLSTIYPGMRAPSFRCMEKENGAILLYYYSERPGLEHVVVGLVKSVARELHGKDVNVQIITSSDDLTSNHVKFLITECSTDCPPSPVSFRISDSIDDYGGLISTQQRISPASFIKIFPFHLVFNRKLQITQVGDALTRVIPEIDNPAYTLGDIFLISRPQISILFEQIRQHSNTAFVLCLRPSIASNIRPVSATRNSPSHLRTRSPLPEEGMEDGDDFHRSKMRLKGQMIYAPESDSIVYICSPYVSNLEDLHERGLYLNDLPVHDATRDLVLLSEQFRAEYELTQRLEVMTQRLQQTYKELEIEKQLTDKLVYSILPPSVANELRLGNPVEAVKYDMVTMLFSGLCDFDVICERNSPLEIVNLLNDLYTKFDMLADPKVNNVYKVETAGDKYLVASGLPEKNANHAKNIALLSLDMIDIAKEIYIDGESVRLCIGIHSGDAVAGVIGQKLPRYCVFGDTVNIASRMETTGMANRINISEATYRCLQTEDGQEQQFSFKERGPLTIKGKRKPIVTYFLTRKARNLPAILALLENGLAMREPLESPPADLLQRRRRSETLYRFQDTQRSARRMSEFIGAANQLEVPRIFIEHHTGQPSDSGFSSPGKGKFSI
ncbi:guanylate cyclase soluble subunit beta-1-like isoform X2 [Lineus longissimus]